MPVNYRCGKAIIDYVNDNPDIPVSNLKAGIDEDGEVKIGEDHDEVMRNLSESWRRNGNKTDMPTACLSRNNSSIIEAGLNFISNDIDFEIIGKDLSKELLKIIRGVIGKGQRDRRTSIPDFAGHLNDYLSDRVSWWSHRVAMADKLKELEEGIESIKHIIYNIEEYDNKTNRLRYYDKRTGKTIENTEDLINYIKSRFGGIDMESGSRREMEKIKELKKRDPNSFITLTTAHRSKGLEFDKVIILDINNFPSGMAKNPAEIRQEYNALYVATTRAKKVLEIPAPPPDEDKGKGLAGW